MTTRQPTQRKPVSPAIFDRLEAIANRRHLAATTPKERCIRALALMAIEGYRRELYGPTSIQEANNGEEAKENDERGMPLSYGRDASVSDEQKTPDSSFIIHHSSLDLDPAPCPPEIPVLAASTATPARRTGRRA